MIPEEVKQQAEKIEILKFRNFDFVNREKEIKYWHRTFFSVPFLIHFVYGPKSCGKTTLLEKVRDDILADKKLKDKIHFFWYDLRGRMLTGYKDVLEFFFTTDEVEKVVYGERREFGLPYGIMKISQESMRYMMERKADPFLVMDNEINKQIAKGKKVVIVLDELQALKDIYINEKRTILKELLNYFVRITKVEHKAVVIGMSSNAFFIEQLYNDSTLEKASKFVYLDYLNLPEIYAWLTRYGFTDEEIEYIWEKVGGDNFLLSEIIQAKKEGEDWREIIELSIQQAKAKIIDIIKEIKNKEFQKNVKNFLKILLKSGGVIKEEIEEIVEDEREVVEYLVENEIIFFDPLRAELWIQFKSHYFAMQELFKDIKS